MFQPQQRDIMKNEIEIQRAVFKKKDGSVNKFLKHFMNLRPVILKMQKNIVKSELAIYNSLWHFVQISFGKKILKVENYCGILTRFYDLARFKNFKLSGFCLRVENYRILPTTQFISIPLGHRFTYFILLRSLIKSFTR